MLVADREGMLLCYYVTTSRYYLTWKSHSPALLRGCVRGRVDQKGMLVADREGVLLCYYVTTSRHITT